MGNESSGGDRALYLMLGAMIGAAVALLLAPRSGEETRKLIMTKAREGADTVSAQTEKVKEKTSEYLGRGKEIVQQQRDSLHAAIDAGKKAYQEEKEKA